LGALLSLVTTAGFAQSSGEALYKAKCQSCHGPEGMASSGVSQILKVRPVNDPAVKQLSEAEMIEMVRHGSGKMQAYKDELTDAQIKSAVDYFRTFIK
jgi:mono/diheme cytochrome c family protein